MDRSKGKIHQILSHTGTLSFLLYLTGLAWFCLLSQDEVNFNTYISENALLAGHVIEKFSDNAQIAQYESQLTPVFAKNDIAYLRHWLITELRAIGLQTYEQNFTFSHPLLHPITHITGTNLYTIMRSPSAGRTEAILLIVPLNTQCSPDTTPCLSASLGLTLSLLKLMREEIYWAKDIVVVFPESDYVGLLAWMEAYHGAENSQYLSWSEIEGRSGAIQAGINLQFSDLKLNNFDIAFVGINGLLANLDLVNTAIRLALKHAMFPVVNGQAYDTERGTWNTRKGDAVGLLRGVWTQASGSSSGLHGLLINYQIPAITLSGPSKYYLPFLPVRSYAPLGKMLEGILRSLNNLQERLHQSFWYYLLPNPMRYISIGVYIPPVLVLIGAMLVKLIGFWKSSSEVEATSFSSSKTKSTTFELFNISDSDQELRHRKPKGRKKHATADGLEISEPKKLKNSGAEVLQIISSLAVWVVCSFLSGLILCNAPSALFRLYQHPMRPAVEESLDIQPFISEFLAAGMLLLFCSLAVWTPMFTTIIRRLFVDHGSSEDKGIWPSCTTLVVWTLFLACTACLNVSTSFVLSVPVVLLLLLFVQPERRHRCVSVLFGLCWFTLSPPMLLVLGSLIQALTFETVSSPFKLNELISSFPHLLSQALLEANLFGCWTWPAVTLGYSSLWMLTWCGLFCN